MKLTVRIKVIPEKIKESGITFRALGWRSVPVAYSWEEGHTGGGTRENDTED